MQVVILATVWHPGTVQSSLDFSSGHARLFSRTRKTLLNCVASIGTSSGTSSTGDTDIIGNHLLYDCIT